MQAIGYVRVSTATQVNDGMSLEAQREASARRCAANGYEIVEQCVDAGVSGGRADNRPALQAARNPKKDFLAQRHQAAKERR